MNPSHCKAIVAAGLSAVAILGLSACSSEKSETASSSSSAKR